jgi:hypothetical protein
VYVRPDHSISKVQQRFVELAISLRFDAKQVLLKKPANRLLRTLTVPQSSFPYFATSLPLNSARHTDSV